jgi:hypothetical protein
MIRLAASPLRVGHTEHQVQVVSADSNNNDQILDFKDYLKTTSSMIPYVLPDQLLIGSLTKEIRAISITLAGDATVG